MFCSRRELGNLMATMKPQPNSAVGAKFVIARDDQRVALRTGVETYRISPKKSHDSLKSGADSGAVADQFAAPALSILVKITAGLDAEERAALARILNMPAASGRAGERAAKETN
jgi:hypothetical protein